jgi:hypothetical protein
VPSEMNPRQREMARHALGLPNRINESYRNHFCIGQDGAGYSDWQDLVAKGFAVKAHGGDSWVGDFFYLTLKGARAVLLPKEHISREDAAVERNRDCACLRCLRICGRERSKDAMTKEELAALLNGREYTKEITESEERLAKGSGLVVIFGASDDLCELRGAINDEVGAWKGTDFLISRDGALLPNIDDSDEEILKKYGVMQTVFDQRKKAIQISAQWCKETEYSWTIVTEEPHATFEIVEGDEKFCRGIVLDLKEL